MPDAKILKSRWLFPFQQGYDQVAATSGGKYDTVDIAGAKQLLGGKTVTVRVGWRKDPQALNKRRVDTIALIQASCKQAGFNVVDTGTPDFFTRHGRPGSGTSRCSHGRVRPLVSGNSADLPTNGGQNPQGYSNTAGRTS